MRVKQASYHDQEVWRETERKKKGESRNGQTGFNGHSGRLYVHPEIQSREYLIIQEEGNKVLLYPGAEIGGGGIATTGNGV